MIKRKNENKRDGLFDLENSISATDFTGLIPFAPVNEYEADSYNSIMDYLPIETSLKAAAEEINKEMKE